MSVFYVVFKLSLGEEQGREIQKVAKEQKQLEEESPYKGIFNEVKNDFYKGLNVASLVMAVRSLPALAKAGFGAIKDLNMALKSLGMDIKSIDEGIYAIENSSKKVAGKLSQEAENMSEALLKYFGNGAGEAGTISKALNDSKTALAEHLEYIKNGGIVKPTGGKFAPSKVSAAINTQTGEIYYGYSGKTGFNPSRADALDEGLQTLVDNTKKLAKNTPNNPYADRESFELWPVDNCAEINAVDQALKNGAKMEDIFIRTVNFKTGEFADYCDNCKVTFKEFMKATE